MSSPFAHLQSRTVSAPSRHEPAIKTTCRYIAASLALFAGISAVATVFLLVRTVQFVIATRLTDEAKAVSLAGCYLAGVWIAIIHLLLALTASMTWLATRPTRS
jgi:hypothetical protein